MFEDPPDNRPPYERNTFVCLFAPVMSQDRLAGWWDLRVLYASGIGGLAPASVEVIDSPAAGFASVIDTETFLRERCENGGAVVAVRAAGRINVDKSSVGRTLAALKRSGDRLIALRAKALAALTGAKSSLVGCKECGSKIARARLTGLTCPVCATSFAPPTTRIAIDAVTDLVKNLTVTARAEWYARPRVPTTEYYALGARLSGPVVDPYAFYGVTPVTPTAPPESEPTP